MCSLFIVGRGTQALRMLGKNSTTGATSPASCMCTHTPCTLMHTNGIHTEARNNVHCLPPSVFKIFDVYVYVCTHAT